MGKGTLITAALVGIVVIGIAVFVVGRPQDKHSAGPRAAEPSPPDTDGDRVWRPDDRPGPPPGRAPGRRGEPMDTDGDGIITFEEASAVMPGLDQDRFNQHDTNGDGVWSADERPGPPHRRGPGRHGKPMDADGDGTVTFEEACAVIPGLDRERFERRDTNGDGVWSRDDHSGHRHGWGRGGHDDPMDSDGDGTVTFKEFADARPEDGELLLRYLDEDGDGDLTEEELPGPADGHAPGPGDGRGPGAGRGPGDGRGPGGGRGPGPGRGPEAMDTNADGQVSFEEATAAQPELTREQFDARDTNGDGVWSRDDRPEGFGGPRGRGGQRGGGRRSR